MGHMHLSGTPHIFEGENDQDWNHMQAEDPYHHLAPVRSAANENGLQPMDNVPISRVNYASAWISPARLDRHSSSSHVAVSRNPSEISGPHGPLHRLATANVHLVPENHPHRSSSSDYAVESNYVGLSMGNGRGPYKRKRPGIPPTSERGSTNGYHSRGCSSDPSSSTDLQLERSNIDVQHTRSERMNLFPTFRSHHLSGEGESSARNVRRRSAFELEYDIVGASQSGNHPHQSNLTRHHLGHSADHLYRGSTVPLPEWNRIVLPAVPRVRTTLPDLNNLTREMSQSFNGNIVSNVAGQTGGYNHDPIDTRNAGVPQISAATMGHSTRGVPSGYVHRSNPAMASVENSHLELAAPPENGLPFAANTYSSRHHRRSIGCAGWRFDDRGGRGRPRFSADHYRSLSVDALGHDRLTPEAMMISGHAALYTSRHFLDQHRDMRLDVDNMSYEELLALGERIGIVNTGVPDDSLPKCLTETLYFSSEPTTEERCSICLEEYKNMDQLATIKACGHDYHGGCIKKWLSMKNLCPICKLAALPDYEK
ncbi:hypothetical protein Dimus_007203 [Dionaea muscipula]